MFPEYVILDTVRVVDLFRRHVKEFGKPADLVDDTIQEVIHCYRIRSKAEKRVDNMVTDMLNRSFQYDCPEWVTHPYNDHVDVGVVSFVLEVSDTLKMIFDELRMYNYRGELMYDYYPTRKERNNSVYMRRNYHATTCPF